MLKESYVDGHVSVNLKKKAETRCFRQLISAMAASNNHRKASDPSNMRKSGREDRLEKDSTVDRKSSNQVQCTTKTNQGEMNVAGINFKGGVEKYRLSKQRGIRRVCSCSS